MATNSSDEPAAPGPTHWSRGSSRALMRMLRHQVYEAITVVNWCGHWNEFILVPEADGGHGQVPVLGAAT